MTKLGAVRSESAPLGQYSMKERNMTRYTMEDVETDNRDGNQTDLHLPNGTILELTLVDMIELLHNIVENTREEQDA